MSPPTTVAARFLALHHQGDGPLLLPNPWDAGSARLLESLGFEALATTSSGFAGTLGRLDGQVTKEEALTHAAALAAAVEVPVSADLEHGFGDAPEEAADTIARAAESGVAGGSIEDYTRRDGGIIYPLEHAAERVRAAVEAAHTSPAGFVLTARAENHIRGNPDLADTIARLQAFQEAGADVLFAPGLRGVDDVRTVVQSIDRPLNVIVYPDGPSVNELGEAGARRISVGGSFSYVAVAAVVRAARELREDGTLGFMADVVEGAGIARAAYS